MTASNPPLAASAIICWKPGRAFAVVPLIESSTSLHRVRGPWLRANLNDAQDKDQQWEANGDRAGVPAQKRRLEDYPIKPLSQAIPKGSHCRGGRVLPDTLPRVEPEVFIVARVNPATGKMERHEYGLVLDREASWMGAVEDRAKQAGV